MLGRATMIAALALVPAGAHAAYQKIEDPTGKVFGTHGGIVVGVANGSRAVELGACVKPGAASGPANYGYYFAAVDPKPGLQSKTSPGRPSCAGDAPDVTTGAADIAGDGAVLHGTVDPNGLQTSVYLQWGTDTKYYRDTPSFDIGAGWDPKDVTISVEGLTSGQQYWYRIVASSSAGVGYGPDKSFIAG